MTRSMGEPIGRGGDEPDGPGPPYRSGGFLVAGAAVELVLALGHVHGAIKGPAALVQPGTLEVATPVPLADPVGLHPGDLSGLWDGEKHVRACDDHQGGHLPETRKCPRCGIALRA